MTTEKSESYFTVFIHTFAFDRGDGCLECFNRVTQNYGLWQMVLVRYCTMPMEDLTLTPLVD
jgi:hypothetical protein